VLITASPAYRRQYCICRCLQLHAISSHSPVASITSTVAYSYIPSPPTVHSGHYHHYRCLQLHAFSSHCPVASITSTVAYSYMPPSFSASSGQYHLYCRLQLHSFSSHCPQWPVSPLLLPTVTGLLLPLSIVASITSAVAYSHKSTPPTVHSGQYHLCCCQQLQVYSSHCPQWPVSPLLLPTVTGLLLPLSTVASITSAVAYSYKYTPPTVHSGQYHLYCCLQLHSFSSHCPQWPVSPLLLPTATSLLFPLPTVASITSAVAYSYKYTPPTVHSGQYHLYCCLQLHSFSSHCPQWPVSPLLLPTATSLLLPLSTVASINSVVAYCNISFLSPVHSG